MNYFINFFDNSKIMMNMLNFIAPIPQFKSLRGCKSVVVIMIIIKVV